MRLWPFKRRPPERKIFRFWDGTQERGIDPLQVLRALNSHPEFDIATHPALATMSAPMGATEADLKHQRQVADGALQITVRAAREAFEVQPYDHATGKGLTEGETADLLDEFGCWILAQKKSTNRQPI